MWVTVRSVALHLQICWQVVIGKGFMWIAFAFGWGLPAIGITITLILSGLSFRFGDTCHLNHTNSFADFWLPLLCFAGLTLIIQLITFGYCIKVYMASLNSSSAGNTSTTNNSALPSYSTSVRTVSPRQAYRRVRRVMELQWRGICVVLLIVADTVYFSVVFVYSDQHEQDALAVGSTKALPWLKCMVTGLGKEYCLQYAGELVVNQASIIAMLILLSVSI